MEQKPKIKSPFEQKLDEIRQHLESLAGLENAEARKSYLIKRLTEEREKIKEASPFETQVKVILLGFARKVFELYVEQEYKNLRYFNLNNLNKEKVVYVEARVRGVKEIVKELFAGLITYKEMSGLLAELRQPFLAQINLTQNEKTGRNRSKELEEELENEDREERNKVADRAIADMVEAGKSARYVNPDNLIVK